MRVSGTSVPAPHEDEAATGDRRSQKTRAAASSPPPPASARPRRPGMTAAGRAQVAVVGAGLMGHGLARALDIHEQILPLIDRTPAPLQILRDTVAAGELGMKSGQGLLPWTEQTAAAAHARLAEHLIAALAAMKAPPDATTTT